jgi:sulfatase maturation enzyme AslB (radical SAM superfamily)
LFEALDYGFGVGYETAFMNTNGTIITEEISKRLAGYGSFSMSVSLDGPEDQHDRIRGKGSYSRTMQGIEKALNRGNGVTVFSTVTKSLIPELPVFVDALYKEFPIIDSLILIQLIRMTTDPFALEKELLEPEDFIRLVRMVALLNVAGLRTIVKKNPIANIVAKLLRMPWIPLVAPLYRKGCLMVMANRNIGVVHSNRNSFGRYKTGMIKKVLASDEYQKTVEANQSTCPSCKYSHLCQQNGMIRPSQGYGDLQADTPYCSRVLDKATEDKGFMADKPGIQEACSC